MSLRDEKTRQYIHDLKKEAEDSTKERRNEAEELWALYQNKQDWSKKKDWQSKICVPKVFMTVEQAASTVKRAIMSPQKLFKAVPINPEDKEALSAAPKVEEFLVNAIRESNFIEAYGSHIKSSFLLGFGSCKVLWDNGLSFSNVDAFDLFIDPDYRSDSSGKAKYTIEHKEMDLHALKEMAKRINRESGRQIYKNLDKIVEDNRDVETNFKQRARRGISEHNKTDKRVKLDEYWGDVVEKGKILKKNQVVVVANDRVIIRQQNNPFVHGKEPYIYTTPIVYPHRGVWGVSLAAPVINLQYAYNNIMNLYVDNLNFSVNKVYEYQPTNLLNPKGLTYVYPGKMVAKHTSAPALAEVKTSGVGQDALLALQVIQSEIEKGTAVTEYLKGTSGKTQTKAEVEIKTAQAEGMFDTIARSIESTSLSPLIEMCFELLIQYGDMPPELRGRYKFRVGGLTLLLLRQEQISRVQNVMGLALQSKTISQMTDIGALYQKYLNYMDLEDVFAKEQQGPNPDQVAQMQEQAAKQAKQDVGKMAPEQVEAALQTMGAQ